MRLFHKVRMSLELVINLLNLLSYLGSSSRLQAVMLVGAYEVMGTSCSVPPGGCDCLSLSGCGGSVEALLLLSQAWESQI